MQLSLCALRHGTNLALQTKRLTLISRAKLEQLSWTERPPEKASAGLTLRPLGTVLPKEILVPVTLRTLPFEWYVLPQFASLLAHCLIAP